MRVGQQGSQICEKAQTPLTAQLMVDALSFLADLNSYGVITDP